ncbi:MKROS protein, partial [Sakesphorus luctuosus]|nr:MKROS protein [Sakesphorus luctuosus]
LAGLVFHFAQAGVQRAQEGWEQCLSIPLLQPHLWDLQQRWDGLLEEFSQGQDWLPHRYDEQEHNCYTFALAFINHVRSVQGRGPLSKAEFTQQFVLPLARRASRYLSLEQQLAHSDMVIVPLPQGEGSA